MSGDFFRKNNKKIRELSNTFKGFPDVNNTKIECWLDNFEDKHKNLAIKLLDNIEYFNQSKIFQASRDLLDQIKTLKRNDLSKVYFCFFGAPQKSGYAVLNMFAVANNLSGSNHTSKFKLLSELPQLTSEEEITIVFIDDFIGTGNQAVNFFNKIQHIIPENTEIILGVVAAFERGITNIQENANLGVICHKRLNEEDMLFSSKNKKFTENEKKILKEYCVKTEVSQTRGYGNCEALVVFPYRTPNNSVPILSVQKRGWNGLFPRYPAND